MSNLTDFFPSGGGGVEINQMAQFANAPNLYIDAKAQEFLKAGIISTNVANYPEALELGGTVSLSVFLQDFSVSSQEIYPEAVALSSDGLNMYMSGLSSTNVYQYTLSTAWDISTAVYLQSFTTSAGQPMGLTFASNGSKMYVVNNIGAKIIEYTLSTPWDISTSSFVAEIVVLNQDNYPRGVSMSTDGTKMFMAGNQNSAIKGYALTTPYAINSAVFTQSFSTAVANNDIYINSNGYIMYVTGGANVYQYTLSTAWDISTAVFLQSFSTSATETQPYGMWFKEDLSIMYLAGRTGQDISQYNIPPIIGIQNSAGLDADTYLRIK